MPFHRAHDQNVRTAAFEWLKARVAELGDVLPRDLLAQGFEYRGRRALCHLEHTEPRKPGHIVPDSGEARGWSAP
jgi:hypothetical protein